MNSNQLSDNSMNVLSQYMNSVANTRDIYDNNNNNNDNNNNNSSSNNHDYDYDYRVDGISDHDTTISSYPYSHYLSSSASSYRHHHRYNPYNNSYNDKEEKDKHRNDIYRRKIEQRKLHYFLLSNGSTVVQSANPEKKKKEQVKERLKKRLEKHKFKEEMLQKLATANTKDCESNNTENKKNLSPHETIAISNNSDIHNTKKKNKKVKSKTGKKKKTKKMKSEHKELNPVEKSDKKQTTESPKKLFDDNNNCKELNKSDVHELLANSDNKDEEEMNLVDSDHSSTCDDLDEHAATGDVAMEVESFDHNLYYQSSPDPTSEESAIIRQTLEMDISNHSFKSMKTEEYLTDHESTKELDESKVTYDEYDEYDEYDDKDEDNNNDTSLISLENQTIVDDQSKEENIININDDSIKKRENAKEKKNLNGSSSVTKHKRKKKSKNQNKNQDEDHSKENVKNTTKSLDSHWIKENNTTCKEEKIIIKEQTAQVPTKTPVVLPLFLEAKEKKLGEFNQNHEFGKNTVQKITSPFSSSPSFINPNSTINAYVVAQETTEVERKRPTKPPISNRINPTVQIQPININNTTNDVADTVTSKRPSKPPLKPSFQSSIVVGNNSKGSRPPIPPVHNFARMKNGNQSSNTMITPISSVSDTTPNPTPTSTPTPTPTPISTFTSVPPLIPIGTSATMSNYPPLLSYPNGSQELLESLNSLLATTAITTIPIPTPTISIPGFVNSNSYGMNAFPLLPNTMNINIPNNNTYIIHDLSTIEQADEWVDFELSSRSYPSSLWTLNMKSLKIHPECSLDKLKVLMSSK